MATERVIIHDAAIAERRPADRPQQRRPQRILAAPFIARVQHGVVNLGARILELAGHHVVEVLALGGHRHQRLDVCEPGSDIDLGLAVNRRASVAPAVAEYVTVARYQHVVAGGVGDADQRRRAHRLAVLVVANARLDAAGGAVGIGVDGVTGNVTEQGVKGGAPNLPTIGHVEIRLIGLDIGKTAIPAGFLDAP